MHGRTMSLSGKPVTRSWLILLLLLWLAAASYAQVDTAWTFRCGGAAGTSYEPLALLVDSTSAARSIYVAGWAEQSSGEVDALLLKIDTSGHYYAWAATYPNMTASGAAMDASGNVYIAGVKSGGTANHGICILKYAPNGELVWAKTYSEQGLDFTSVGTIAIDSQHVYACAGADSAVRIIKYSLTGTITPDSVISCIISGKSIAGGQFYMLKGGGAYLVFSGLAVKVSSQGSVLWNTAYGDTSNLDVLARWSQIDDKGNIFIATSVTPRTSPPEASLGTIKIDSSGNKLWVKTYNGPENLRDEPRFLIVDHGNVYVAGWSQHVYMGMNGSIALVKYDSLGNQQWARRFGSEDDTDADVGYDDMLDEPTPDFYPSMNVDDSGDVYVTGGLYHSSHEVAILLKCDAQGNLVSVRQLSPQGQIWDGAIVDIDKTGGLYQIGRTIVSVGDSRRLGIFVAKYLGR